MDDALIPLPPAGVNIGLKHDGGERQRPPKVIRQAPCPHCCFYGHTTIGVIRQIDTVTHKQREVFKPHTKQLGSGPVHCAGSGQEAPLP